MQNGLCRRSSTTSPSHLTPAERAIFYARIAELAIGRCDRKEQYKDNSEPGATDERQSTSPLVNRSYQSPWSGPPRVVNGFRPRALWIFRITSQCSIRGIGSRGEPDKSNQKPAEKGWI